VKAVPDEPNVLLRPGPDEQLPEVVLAFPYDGNLVAAVRTLPGRRFDWDRREWVAPADDWVAVKLRKILRLYPDLSTSAEVDAWLAAASSRWVGHVRTAAYDGRGWWALDTLAGTVPAELQPGSVEHEDRTLIPLTAANAAVLAEMGPGRLSLAAARCLDLVEHGVTPPPARMTLARGVAGERFSLEVLWDHDAAAAFEQLPGAARNELKLDSWIADQLDEFIVLHGIEVAASAAEALDGLVAEHRAAQRAIAASRKTADEPLPDVAAVLGGELAPFQWVAVRYAL
jgi:SWI/SNF-related matrix-associated actin-dependent regulator of chromatin subfamily A-like protein 1